MKVYKFSASWCQPCKALSKLLTQLNTTITIEEIDIDSNIEKAKNFSIRGVPTMVLVNNNDVEVKRLVGVPTLNELQEFLPIN
jgi:thioredoxin 1